MQTRDDADNPSRRDYGDHTEFGGGPARNRVKPDGTQRNPRTGEEASDMRRAGLRSENSKANYGGIKLQR